MGLFKITLTDDKVITSYMGSRPNESPISDAWYGLIQCLRIGGDVIDVSDERDPNQPLYMDLSFTFNTDTAERTLPSDEEPIDPMKDLDALLDWLEENPDELKRLTKLINESRNQR